MVKHNYFVRIFFYKLNESNECKGKIRITR